MFEYTNDEFLEIYNLIFQRITKNKNISSDPVAYILGGQPGAGKSYLQRNILKNNENCIVINADAFRESHPHYFYIQNLYGDDASIYTQPFINKVTEQLIKDLSDKQYNLIIEGTLRTAEIPLKTCKMLKNKEYTVELQIISVKKEISYESTILRYENAIAAGKIPRATSKEHHDKVVNAICENLDLIYNQNLFNDIKLFDRNDNCLYSVLQNIKPSKIENSILNGVWSISEKKQLNEIITEVINLKLQRNSPDLENYISRIEKLLEKISENSAYFVELTANEADQLRQRGIKFEGKISLSGKSVIKLQQSDVPKAKKILKDLKTTDNLHKK